MTQEVRSGRVWFVVLFLGLLVLPDAKAAKIKTGDDGFLVVSGFIQPTLGMVLDPPDDSADVTTDFYLRRVRLFFKGRLNENLRFFFGTLNLNVGKAGDYSSRMMFGDAWAEYWASDAFMVNVGLLKLPFGRHSQQGGGGLHGIDFHGVFLNEYYVKRAKTSVPTRDIGVMFRGLVLDRRIDYRVAVVDGLEPGAEDVASGFGAQSRFDLPRVVGRVAFNVFDAEPEYFFKGTHLGKKKVLTFGVSADVQPGVRSDTADGVYYAFAVDALADLPMGENGLTVTLNGYLWGPGGAHPEGVGFWGDCGYRIKRVEPMIAVEVISPKEGDAGSRLAFLPGINWWIRGHRATLKAQFGLTQVNRSGTWAKEGLIQSHLMF